MGCRIVLWSFALFFSCQSVNIEREKISEVEEVSEEELKKRFLYHRRLMYECFKDYMEFSSFQDTNGRVTDESVARFKELFLGNARVWNDYAWKPEMVDANVYGDYAYIYHRLKGLKVEYEAEVLNRFFKAYREEFNPTVDNTDVSNNTYRYVFRANKKIYYILNKDNKVLYYDEPMEYELDFVFYVSSKEKWAKIMDILPVTK